MAIDDQQQLRLQSSKKVLNNTNFEESVGVHYRISFFKIMKRGREVQDNKI